MGDDGYEPTSDELWANTNPTGGPAVPPTEPTIPAPTTPDPTMVQPTVGGAPPPLPPGGGPPPPMPPGGDPPDDNHDERPAWLLPVAAGLVGALLLGLVLVLLLRDDGNESAEIVTTLDLTGTTVPGSSIPDTTIESTTTSELAPDTTLETTTTIADETTTTEPPATSTSTTTTTSTTTITTTIPAPVLPSPGFALVDGITYPLQASCFTVPL